MIEFLEDIHVYLVGGVITPSVSSLVRWKLGSYEDVPKGILFNKAEFGTKVHELVEMYNKGEKIDTEGDLYLEHCLKQYEKLMKDYKVISQEDMVHYGRKYAGRFDIVSTKDGKRYLQDVKTTYAQMIGEWTLQLNLYRLAYEYLGLGKIDGLQIIWIRKKNLGRLIDIEMMDDKELEEIIEEYHEKNRIS